MHKLKINLFGESWRLTRLNLSDATYNQLLFKVETMNGTLSDVLLESILFDEGGFNLVQGLLDTYKKQIEIWYAGKKIKKLKMVDLDNTMSLFPLYHSTIEVLKYVTLPKGIYIEQEEIGLVACYETNLESININDLSFELMEVKKQANKFEILNGISYKNLPITRFENKIDTLITKQIYFEV